MDAVEYNKKQYEDGKLTDVHITELVRHWQETHDLETDGQCGPVTLSTIDAILVPDSPPRDKYGHIKWAPWDGPEHHQPVSRQDIYEQFGNPGSAVANTRWAKENITECHKRYDSRLPGVPAKWYVKVNKIVEPYLREALRRAQVASPEYVIERIAGYVFRHIRRDSRRPLSTHSWGISFDIDPHRNFSRTFRRGKGPVAWSDEYMKIWPNGVTKEFVSAFRSCGFAWGSDWDEDGMSTDHTYYDPMHFEWVARDGNSILV